MAGKSNKKLPVLACNKKLHKRTKSLKKTSWYHLFLEIKNPAERDQNFHSSTLCYSRSEKHDIDYPMITEDAGFSPCPVSGAGKARITFSDVTSE
ncbi:MAG: hypothetical protein A3J63_02215 [Candidatus Moranbacteria bacterium RIFCSPHIGHO2_02_FULL_40_12b]|nr:MAG: hypothetical protein A3J63_02215 [Candidatus Moranbacteria bacterium RIFCSPHIGHO2_02_FULL_40_12b]